MQPDLRAWARGDVFRNVFHGAAMKSVSARFTSRLGFVLIFFISVLLFIYMNLEYSGPVIFPDEPGYLANAAFLAGFEIDAASSFHFGYSLLISPLYLLFDAPDGIWNGIVILNALLFACSFILGYALLLKLNPSISPLLAAFITSIAALYPAWMSISGYAFSQPLFVFLFTAAAFAIVMAEERPSLWLVAAVLSGLLVWVHPLGICVAGATGILILLARPRPLIIIGAIVLMAAVIVSYLLVLHPIWRDQMTPDGLEPFGHYPSLRTSLSLLTPEKLLAIATRALGQAVYVVLATLGVVVLPVVAGLNYLISRRPRGGAQIGLLFLLSAGGIAIFSAATFEVSPGTVRLDHWMYGRYIEGILLPVLIVGLGTSAHRDIRRVLAVVGLVVVYAALLFYLSPAITNASPVNSSGFWPLALVPDWGIGLMLALATGATVFGMLLPMGLLRLVLAASFLLCLSRQFTWHDMAMSWQPKPTLVEIVRATAPPGSCVGLDFAGGDTTRAYPFFYYLYDYKLRRVPLERWKDCDGPMLSYRMSDEATWIAREKSGLILSGRGPVPTNVPEDIFVASEGPCLKAWCYGRTAQQLRKFSLVGQFADGRLNTDGRAGFFFFGPYSAMDAGSYTVAIDARIDHPGDGYFDVHANGKVVTKVPLSTTTFTFDLPARARDFQIRAVVAADTVASVAGYLISRKD